MRRLSSRLIKLQFGSVQPSQSDSEINKIYEPVSEWKIFMDARGWYVYLEHIRDGLRERSLNRLIHDCAAGCTQLEAFTFSPRPRLMNLRLCFEAYIYVKHCVAADWPFGKSTTLSIRRRCCLTYASINSRFFFHQIYAPPQRPLVSHTATIEILTLLLAPMTLILLALIDIFT